nr:two-component sensor histidine kinase bacteria, putative [Tanacetum cinerariifolium]
MSHEIEPQPSRPAQAGKLPSHLSFPVVGIGASAGGLDAVRRFFEHMPSDSGMAFVVVFHLSPDHESSAAKLIGQMTTMPVIQVESVLPIEENHVYVISPAQYLSMNDGYLRISPQGPRRGAHVTIDLFFRDLADVHRERAFCLVLSGAGADGAVGLSRIKEQGGVTLVQSPSDAEHDGMPQAAIRTEMVDFVLPVADMPAKLIELWENSRHIQLPASNDLEAYAVAPKDERSVAIAEQTLHDILVRLRVGTGHDFKHYKRATVLRRIERRMQVTAQPTLTGYYEYLCANPSEVKALLDDMLIGVTNFFRDREAFDALERDVAPQLFSRYADHTEQHDLRIWSAGASTGEEAYSLVMLLSDHKASVGSDVGIQRVVCQAQPADRSAVLADRPDRVSESADLCQELFSVVDKKNRIFRARTGAIPSHRMPTLPRGGYAQVTSAPRPPFVEPVRKPSIGSIHQRALQQFLVTPSILVNNVADVLHISDGAGRYLHHVSGESINEELLTVNHELKIKVEETDQVNDYLRNLISSTDIATVFVDRNCCIKWFTPRATDIFSMLTVDTGRPLMDITHRLHYDDMMSDALKVFETLSVIEREVEGKNGRWYIARLLPYRSGSDQIDGIVLTFIDITTQRLRLISENTRDYAIIVVDEQSRISSWNNGAEAIFGYSKSEAEGKPVVDFLELVKEIRGVVEHSEHQRSITFDMPDGEGIYIEADATRVEQIVWNLINNAIKFTPAGGSVTVSVTSADSFAWLQVSDTGPGIEKSQLEHIFQMFGQANHRPSNGHKGGLGIGLSLVKQLVEAHGGSISAHSDGPGQGATFKVGFPLSSPPVRSIQSEALDDEGQLSGIKVLLVDDSPEVLETMTLLLEMEQAHVVAIADARQALDVAKDIAFDVVISDVGMPFMDGYEFVRLLRQMPDYARTPCIALTGYGADQVTAGKDASGFDECVGKPVPYDDLIEVLRRLRRIDAWDESLKPVHFFKRGDRSVQGHLNEVLGFAAYDAYEGRGLAVEYDDLVEFDASVNSMIRTVRGTDSFIPVQRELQQACPRLGMDMTEAQIDEGYSRLRSMRRGVEIEDED